MAESKYKQFLEETPEEKRLRMAMKAQYPSASGATPEELDSLEGRLRSRQEVAPVSDVESVGADSSEASNEAPSMQPAPLAAVIARTEKQASSSSTPRQEQKETIQEAQRAALTAEKSGYDASELSQALERAKEVYESEKSRADWGEVAQMLGRSLAQLGAASEGLKTDRDMSGLQFGPGIDYARRSDRAGKDYDREVGTIEGKQKLRDQALREEKSFAEKGEDRKFRETEAQKDRDAAMARLKVSESKGDDRAAIAARRELANISSQEIKSLEAEKKDALAGIQGVADELAGDASDKAIAQFRSKHPRELGTLDPADIAAAREAAQEPGMLYGTNLNKEKFKAELYDQAVSKYNEKIANLRQGIQSLYGKSEQDKSLVPAQPQQQQQPQKIRVRDKASGQTGTLDSADFDPAKYEKI